MRLKLSGLIATLLLTLTTTSVFAVKTGGGAFGQITINGDNFTTNISSPASNSVLTYDGSNWVDGTTVDLTALDVDNVNINGHIISATTGDGISLYDDSGAAGLRVEDGGFVGIGITDPTHRLHVNGTVTESMKISSAENAVELRFGPNSSTFDSRIGSDANSSASSIYFETGGSERVRIGNAGGITVGSPTGGNKGDGTINAVGVYDDDSLLSDHVFEKYYLGYAKDKRHKNFKMNTLDDEIDFVKNNLHLSTIVGRSEWENRGKKSLGKLVTQLWETVEVQHLYITQLNERIKELEKNMEGK